MVARLLSVVDRELVSRVKNVWHLEPDFCSGNATATANSN